MTKSQKEELLASIHGLAENAYEVYGEDEEEDQLVWGHMVLADEYTGDPDLDLSWDAVVRQKRDDLVDDIDWAYDDFFDLDELGHPSKKQLLGALVQLELDQGEP
ncbi:MAG: hypothetical protein ACYTFN_14765 [Planctomycetota bacterium]|jgi:hypothetical protein